MDDDDLFVDEATSRRSGRKRKQRPKGDSEFEDWEDEISETDESAKKRRRVATKPKKATASKKHGSVPREIRRSTRHVGTDRVNYQEVNTLYGVLSDEENKVDSKLYCVCQKHVADELMIECSLDIGGCNGWVHPKCCGFQNMSQNEAAALKHFICPLCQDRLRFMSRLCRERSITPVLAAEPSQPPGRQATRSTAVPRELKIDLLLSKRVLDGDPPEVEYFVKWKGKAYMHCSWVPVSELEMIGGAGFKRRQTKFEERWSFCGGSMEDEPFDPAVKRLSGLVLIFVQFVEVHRLIATETSGSKKDPLFLVKWCNLPYSQCTWEVASDIQDSAKIKEFKRREAIPPHKEWFPPKPPPADTDTFRPLSGKIQYGEGLILRDYQVGGLNWLIWNYLSGKGSVLADEMGLGKTIQTVAFLHHLWTNPEILCRGPFLVIAPLSTLRLWQDTVQDWGMGLNCCIYHGDCQSRDLCRLHEFEFDAAKVRSAAAKYASSNKKRKVRVPKLWKFHVLVTSYEVIMADVKLLSKIPWKVIIVDEAHRMKSKTSRLAEKLVTFKKEHLILLTGTPIQNNTEELWSLMNFLSPGVFGTQSEFMEKFGELKNKAQIEELQFKLKPYLLRRVKEDVEKALPPKEETIINVELTPIQKTYYKAIYEKNTRVLLKGTKTTNLPSLMNIFMELRKCCNHPFLTRGVEEALLAERPVTDGGGQLRIDVSGKLVLLDKLLPRLKSGGHKVLIFSQMVRMLDILADYCCFRDYQFERLDGRIRGDARQAAIDRFVRKESVFLMLLSTRAGGLGINLTVADTVLIYDSDWNPQNDLQAQARAHRIGQTAAVKVYRLLTSNSYEELMFSRASKKLGLDNALLHNLDDDGSDQSVNKLDGMSASDVDKLLKVGAYGAMCSDDDAGKKFCEADIDAILDRAHIVKYDSQGGSTFSRASFVSSTTNEEVNFDDPQFWTKTIGFEAPMTEAEELVASVPEQRVRKGVERFGFATKEELDAHSDLNLSSDEEVKEEEDDADDAYVAIIPQKKRKSAPRQRRTWSSNDRDTIYRQLRIYGYGRWGRIVKSLVASRWMRLAKRHTQALSMFSRCILDEAVSAAKDVLYERYLHLGEEKAKEMSGKRSWAVIHRMKVDEAAEIKSVSALCFPAHERRQNIYDTLDDGTRNLLAELSPPPECLQESRFQSKLRGILTGKANAQARARSSALRTLERLDTLLHVMNAVEAAMKELLKDKLRDNPEGYTVGKKKILPYSAYGGVDDAFSNLPPAEVGERLVFVIANTILESECRKVAPWFTMVHLRNLVLGVFRHGWNKYDQVRSDKKLIFSTIKFLTADQLAKEAKEAPKQEATSMAASVKQEATSMAVPPTTAGGKQEATSMAVPPTTEQEAPAPPVGVPWPDAVSMNRLVKLALTGSTETEDAGEVLVTSEEWTPKEKRGICQAILKLGLPLEASLRSLSEPADCIMNGLPPAPGQMSIRWEHLTQEGGLLKNVCDVKEFATHRLLPHLWVCAEYEKSASLLGGSGGRRFIDPDRDPNDYPPFLRRNAASHIDKARLFHAVRCSLVADPPTRRRFKEYLFTPAARSVSDMPVWWCPVIHDYALMCGIARHGFMWRRIRGDKTLALGEEQIREVRVAEPTSLTLAQFVGAVFMPKELGFQPLSGEPAADLRRYTGGDFLPIAGRQLFPSAAVAEQWLKQVSALFPDEQVVENRIKVGGPVPLLTARQRIVGDLHPEIDLTIADPVASKKSKVTVESMLALFADSHREELRLCEESEKVLVDANGSPNFHAVLAQNRIKLPLGDRDSNWLDAAVHAQGIRDSSATSVAEQLDATGDGKQRAHQQLFNCRHHCGTGEAERLRKRWGEGAVREASLLAAEAVPRWEAVWKGARTLTPLQEFAPNLAVLAQDSELAALEMRRWKEKREPLLVGFKPKPIEKKETF